MNRSCDARRMLSASFAFVLAATVTLRGEAAPENASLPFTVVSQRYFVKNTVPLRSRTFFVIRSEAAFAAIFGYGAFMDADRKPRVSPRDFASQTVLAAVARGPLCTLTAQRVTERGTHVSVAYAAQCAPPGSASYAVPLILMIPGANVRSATFLENARFAGNSRAS